MMRGTAPVAGPSPLVAALARHRVVAVVRHHDADIARDIAWACVTGGLGLIEITLTTPDADALISDLTARVSRGVTVGAGTVVDPTQVATSVAAGAAFLVSPATDPDVLAAAATAGVPLIPGAATPTEVARGARLGAPVVKIFPAGCLGVPFLRAIAAVMPDVPLLPSGGIAAADASAWLDAGALAVAIGSDLDAAHARGGADAVAALAGRMAAAASAPAGSGAVSAPAAPAPADSIPQATRQQLQTRMPS